MLSTAMMLEAVGRQLEAWEMPLESSWRCLDAPEAAFGELLEASWRLQCLLWRAPGSVLEAPRATWMPLASLRGLLGALGIILQASWELLELS